MLIDRDQIATVGYLGYAHPAATFLSQASGDFFDSDLQPATYDIAAANKILDDASYLDSDGDGVISKKELAKAATALKKLDLDVVRWLVVVVVLYTAGTMLWSARRERRQTEAANGIQKNG